MDQKYPLILMFLSVSYLFASGGKIAGQITSMETGEPLPGVNVLVEEVFLGAATDPNGEYVILNVPTGYHTLSASYIGYSKYVVKELGMN